jgi:hypothetical protein
MFTCNERCVKRWADVVAKLLGVVRGGLGVIRVLCIKYRLSCASFQMQGMNRTFVRAAVETFEVD